MNRARRKLGLAVAAFGLALALIFGIAAVNTPSAGAQTTPQTTTANKAAKTANRVARHIVANVTAVNGQQLTLEWRSWTQTITVGSDVSITKADKTIALSDIKVGDQVRLQYKKGADGKRALSAIRVVLPKAAGTVTAVNGNSFTLSRTGRKTGKTITTTVTTDANTVFTKGRTATAVLSDVTVNSRVVVVGTLTGDSAITAAHVYIGAAKK